MTVRNEKTLLAHNLRFHRATGVDAFYLFDDGSTDSALDSVSDIPGVHIEPTADPSIYFNHPDLGWIARRAHELISARQTLNAHVAFEAAGRAGHEWMISMDADELLFLQDPAGIEGSVARYFASLPADVDSVIFEPAELIPTRVESPDPFRESSYFRTTPRNDSRTIRNPYTRETITLNSFIGHRAGKAAARIRPDIVHKSAHRFTSLERGDLRERNARWLLHYNIHSFENFVEKYRKFKGFPDTWLSGVPVEQPRALWIRMTNDPAITEEELLDYYQANILESEIGLDGKPDVRKFGKVARFFAGQSA